jgi:hypothetical protein
MQLVTAPPRAARRAARAVLLALLVLGAATACMHYPSAAQKLQKSVMTYNHCIRWQQWKSAAQFIPAAKRDDFLAQKEAQQATFRVTEMEIRDVDHNDAAEPPTAKVVVDFTWHRYPSLTMQHTRVRQTWKLLNDAWILEGQEEIVAEEEPQTADQMF